MDTRPPYVRRTPRTLADGATGPVSRHALSPRDVRTRRTVLLAEALARAARVSADGEGGGSGGGGGDTGAARALPRASSEPRVRPRYAMRTDDIEGCRSGSSSRLSKKVWQVARNDREPALHEAAVSAAARTSWWPAQLFAVEDESSARAAATPGPARKTPVTPRTAVRRALHESKSVRPSGAPQGHGGGEPDDEAMVRLLSMEAGGVEEVLMRASRRLVQGELLSSASLLSRSMTMSRARADGEQLPSNYDPLELAFAMQRHQPHLKQQVNVHLHDDGSRHGTPQATSPESAGAMREGHTASPLPVELREPSADENADDAASAAGSHAAASGARAPPSSGSRSSAARRGESYALDERTPVTQAFYWATRYARAHIQRRGLQPVNLELPHGSRDAWLFSYRSGRPSTPDSSLERRHADTGSCRRVLHADLEASAAFQRAVAQGDAVRSRSAQPVRAWSPASSLPANASLRAPSPLSIAHLARERASPLTAPHGAPPTPDALPARPPSQSTASQLIGAAAAAVGSAGSGSDGAPLAPPAVPANWVDSPFIAPRTSTPLRSAPASATRSGVRTGAVPTPSARAFTQPYARTPTSASPSTSVSFLALLDDTVEARTTVNAGASAPLGPPQARPSPPLRATHSALRLARQQSGGASPHAFSPTRPAGAAWFASVESASSASSATNA